MGKDEMKLAYLCFDEGGCAYYRSILPHETMAKAEGIPVLKIEKGASPEKYMKLVEADLIQLGRISAAQPLRDTLMKLKHQHNTKLVLEFDDNVFKVNPYSPHYMDYGLEDFNDEYTGIQIWKDGVGGFDTGTNRNRLDGIKWMAENSDLITVTQPELAKVFSNYNENVICLPNCVDMSHWNKLPIIRKNSEEIRLFWQGGCSHYVDWLHLTNVLPEIIKKYPNVKLVIMGQLYDGTLSGVPKDRIEHHRWAHFEAYPYKVATLDPDIALIPLDDNEFNRCKSNIKWVEMAAMGVPCVVSAVTPYFEHYNGKNMVAVDNDDESWFKGLSAVIDDTVLRSSIAGNAKKTVEDNFNITKEYIRWYNAYKELISA